MHWLLILPGIVLGLIASVRLRWAHGKYLKVPVTSGVSGFEAARKILDANGLTRIPVIEIRGHVTDHYDLLKKRLCLSSENHRGRSIAAVGIAAHEAGHALQQREDYAPLRFRVRLMPIMNLATPLAIVLLLIGLLVKSPAGQIVFPIGIGLFLIATLFQLFILPVELDASKRAKEQLVSLGLVSESETRNISKMLNAASMTYLTGLVNFSGLFSFTGRK